MADDFQERTEQPTPKRQREAAEQGEVPRSRELATAAMLIGGAGAALAFGGGLVEAMLGLMRASFTLDARQGVEPQAMHAALAQALGAMLGMLTPFLLLLTVIAVAAPLALGGWQFSPAAMGFKWERVDPLAGLGRVFSARGLIELAKALAKFAVIAAVAVFVLWRNEPALLGLGAEPLPRALAHAGERVGWIFLWLALPTLLVAAADVPIQLWQHGQKLRMTLQEVKDEARESDGRPEVKGRIRRLQMEFANRRMMEKVPHADAVLVNPTHYAVALRYEQAQMAAPLVVALGVDAVALHIRAIAAAHGVAIVESPLLARALYYNARLDRPIPVALYVAVAQVLAYVYQLRAEAALPATPIRLDGIDIPPGLRTG
ncbi:flagellar biosynthetic protein FlhB [Plasticicumulans lactativorans]|uniref:Flagellar biosynthetic protein FlhB n=1 Tax=Plasticicumulans lactativorans TaxID=1133106 RepID=A0A4R2L6H8_9GAMM|nr:flagellar biosynthesis protein FlhB [Plasticicumulans lactativorans]TCO79679.1 flagellar biosynthetic protein FlhB [Plasticicumulans lactativorans]